MSNALVSYQTEQGMVELTPDTVKKYLVNGNGNVSDQEVKMFLELCKYQRLNPFLREAYLIKFGTSPATMIVGKEVFTKRAAKLKECKGWQAGIVIIKQDGMMERREGTLKLKSEELVGGWCKVYKEGWEHPMVSEVSLEEYNKGQSSWKTMPAVMIRKVAIVSALRDAFPEDFQGLYDSAEMPADTSKLDETPINQEEIFETDYRKEIGYMLLEMTLGDTEGAMVKLKEIAGFTSLKDLSREQAQFTYAKVKVEFLKHQRTQPIEAVETDVVEDDDIPDFMREAV